MLNTHLRQEWIEQPEGTYTKGNCTVRMLITGVGMHRMAFALGNTFALHNPDLCINGGIAGAFQDKFAIGDVVNVISEKLIGFGAENHDGAFLSIDDLNLVEDISSLNGLVNIAGQAYTFLPLAHGITSNMTHGTESSIRFLTDTYDPDIETMEGAAFFYACMKSGIPFLEIRAISNIVEPRKKDNWNIPLAVKNLNEQLLEILRFFI
jgi:futalosine hydrolase